MMNKTHALAMVCMLVLFSNARAHGEGAFWKGVKGDYREFYSGENMLYLGGGLLVGGVIANTDADQNVQDRYQEDMRDSGTDDFAKLAKVFGEGTLVVPVYLGACLLQAVLSDVSVCGYVGEWGVRSLRGVIVGAPPLLLLQVATGGTRPSDDDPHSDWQPFSDGNGVSGHAFMGAIPFISAAKMVESVWMKTALYAGSMLAGWSRVNDDDHYLSQALLGWWLAYLSESSVNQAEREGSRVVQLVPDLRSGFTGVGLQIRF